MDVVNLLTSGLGKKTCLFILKMVLPFWEKKLNNWLIS